MYIYDHKAGQIVDADDGQLIATMSESATHEQGRYLAATPQLLEVAMLAAKINPYGSVENLRVQKMALDALLATKAPRIFEPEMKFESVNEAVDMILDQDRPEEALLAVVRANVNFGEFGFAGEVLQEYGSRS